MTEKKDYNSDRSAMEVHSKNIVLQFDSASLAVFQKLLEEHLSKVTELLSLDGTDDEKTLLHSLAAIEEEHQRVSDDSFNQMISMIESLKKIIKRNLNELIEIERRIQFAEAVLSEKAEELQQIIREEKYSKTEWNIQDLYYTKRVFNLSKLVANYLAQSWLAAFKELLISSDFAIPPSLDNLFRKRRKRRLFELLAWISLLLTLISFAPAIALPAGIVAVIWFLVERRFFVKSELKELKTEGRLLREIKESITNSLDKVQKFRIEVGPWNAKDFLNLLSPVLTPLEDKLPPDVNKIVALEQVLGEVVKLTESNFEQVSAKATHEKKVIPNQGIN